jgi:hypothetical protein
MRDSQIAPARPARLHQAPERMAPTAVAGVAELAGDGRHQATAVRFDFHQTKRAL